ncbi:uncharacterized protein SOCE26_035520 [Sorangium cellulosum]|uniref:Uncharacterized protein n=1 Tax=Sorangium cellulosum TaxID=56 RepID=A0A2L0ES61_SORCE|nr:hypothetical protein [Sorangium cellulosum]AUX42125.1 uncharacterized protein SOCE26_035520 [Sorangium cellulosum]
MERCRRGISCFVQLAAVALSLGLAAGCGGIRSSYVPTAGSPRPMRPKPPEDVEVFLSKPDRSAQEVGMLEVQQDVGNDADPNALMNELRRVAAERGCDGVLVSGANDSVAGARWMQLGAGALHTRTLKGYRATCLVFTDTRSYDPPRGGGGFVFGAGMAASAAACTGASLTWSASAPGWFSCSGAPADLGLKATAALGFCADLLCRVELKVEPKGGSAAAWRDEVRAIRAALERKYGRPAIQEGSEPPDCATSTELCATSARFTHADRWSWPSGERLDLTPRGLAGPAGRPALPHRADIPLVQERSPCPAGCPRVAGGGPGAEPRGALRQAGPR